MNLSGDAHLSHGSKYVQGRKLKCVLICSLVSTPNTTLDRNGILLPPEAGLQGTPANLTLYRSILTLEILSGDAISRLRVQFCNTVIISCLVPRRR